MKQRSKRGLSLAQRLEDSIIGELDDDKCWITSYAPRKLPFRPNGVGHPRIFINEGRRHVSTHVLAWELHNAEPVPPGMCVMHTCDNPLCVNPSHLVLGTIADNNADCRAKGRHRGGRRKS